MDALAAAIWYGITLIAVRAAWVVARRTFPRDESVQTTLHSVVLIWTWVVLVSTVLGAIGVLNAGSLGIGVLLVSAATWLWSGTWKQDTVAASDQAVSSAECVRSVLEDGTPVIRETHGSIRLWSVFWVVMAAVAGTLIIARGLLRFPDKWDALAYHRPLIDHWLQTGALYVPQCAMWHVPGNNELMGLWWAAPFSGDFWVGLINVPAILVLALGTLELGRLMGLTLTLRHSAVLAVVGSAVIYQQIPNAKNDIAVAGLCVAGLAYGMRYLASRSWQDLAFGGFALGLLAGIKYYALGYAGVVWLVVSAGAWFGVRRRTFLTAAALLGATLLLVGGYWYGRNLLVTGTPFYPLGYTGPRVTEAQMARSAWQSSLLGNGRLELWPQYVAAVWKQGGLVQAGAVLALPATVLWLFVTALVLTKRSNRNASVRRRCCLAFAVFGAWIIFGMTPFTIDAWNDELLKGAYLLVRFSLAPLALSVTALSLLLSDVSRWIHGEAPARRWRVVCSALLPALFLIAAFTTCFPYLVEVLSEDWVVHLLLTFDLALLYVVVRELFHGAKRYRAGTRRVVVSAVALSGMCGFVLASSWLSDWWHGGFAASYNQRFRTNAFSLLEKDGESGSSIAVLDYRYYPFFGSKRQFRPWRMRRAVSPDHLLTWLASHKIGLVAVTRNDSTYTARYADAWKWLEDRGDLFEEFAVAAGFTVFRVHRDRLSQTDDSAHTVVLHRKKTRDAVSLVRNRNVHAK